MVQSFNLIIWLGSLYECKKYKETQIKFTNLTNQNNLQESQISELTHYVNLTMIHVQEHHGVLCELDPKLLVFNNTLAKAMEVLNYLHYMKTFLLISVQQ